jgi:hypothetical protein
MEIQLQELLCSAPGLQKQPVCARNKKGNVVQFVAK